jgi:hypothetical protein
MIHKLKQWYWILTSIWIVFWVLDVLVLVPLYPDGIMSNIKGIFSDQTELAFIYLLITAPIYLYLIFMFISKIVNKIRMNQFALFSHK